MALLRRGLQLLGRHKKAICFSYLLNLSLAGILLPSFLRNFDRSLGQGLYREKLIGKLDYDWLSLFRERFPDFGSDFGSTTLGLGPFAHNLETLLDGKMGSGPAMLAALGGLYLLLHSFLLGAALGSFCRDPQGTSLREFFRTGGVFFGRFFRTSLLAVTLFTLLTLLIAQPSLDWVARLTQNAFTEVPILAARLIRYLLLLVLFLFLNMLMDYTKLRIALEDRTSVILAFLSATTFCLRNFFFTYGLYLLIVVLSVLWVLFYSVVEYALPQESWPLITVAFLWQQFYLLGRLSFKLLFYSTQAQVLVDRPG